jgi:hypothetical protein
LSRDHPNRIPLVAGVLSVVVGAVALAYPGPTLLAVGIIAATFARILGVIVGLIGVLTGLILLVRDSNNSIANEFWRGFD